MEKIGMVVFLGQPGKAETTFPRILLSVYHMDLKLEFA